MAEIEVRAKERCPEGRGCLLAEEKNVVFCTRMEDRSVGDFDSDTTIGELWDLTLDIPLGRAIIEHLDDPAIKKQCGDCGIPVEVYLDFEGSVENGDIEAHNLEYERIKSDVISSTDSGTKERGKHYLNSVKKSKGSKKKNRGGRKGGSSYIL